MKTSKLSTINDNGKESRMKRRILFVINTMGQGGAEVAMIELLKELPRLTDCEIDLYVMLGQGELIDRLPPHVNLLNKKMDSSDVLSSSGRFRLYRHTLARLISGFSGLRNLPYIVSNYRQMRRVGNVAAKNLLWKAISDGTKPPSKKYDVAVAYIEGASTYYVADKVQADAKAAFFHTNYYKAGYNRKLDHGCYECFQEIFCVSNDVRSVFLSEYPELADRVHIMRNIIDSEEIIRKSKTGEGFGDDFDGIRIASIGRLVKLKSFDVAIEAASILKERGHKIRWSVFGEGEERSVLESKIKDSGLENEFILYGTVSNPFPYLRESQIFVQCSKYEGQSMAVREAKVLGLAIVLSLCEGNNNQIIDGVDGIYVASDALSIADGIESLIKNPELRLRLGSAAAKSNQKHEDAAQMLRLFKN